MNSAKKIVVILVFLAICEIQESHGAERRVVSRREVGRSISKRSLSELLQLVPWMRNSVLGPSRTNGSETSPSTNQSFSASIGSGLTQLLGLGSGQESHNVSRRSISELKRLEPVVAKVEDLLRTLPTGGILTNNHNQALNLNGMLTSRMNPQQTILFLHNNGPLGLMTTRGRPLGDAVPLTTTTMVPVSPPSPSPVVIKPNDEIVPVSVIAVKPSPVLLPSTTKVLVSSTVPSIVKTTPVVLPITTTIAPLPGAATTSSKVANLVSSSTPLLLATSTTVKPTTIPSEIARNDQFISDMMSIP